MKDTKPTHESPHDGTLRIPRRRAGIYQPKDSIGLSCIMQVNNQDDIQALTRRRTLTAPRDNIGISCLPAKNCNSQTSVEIQKSETEKKISPRQQTIEKPEEYLESLPGGAPKSMLNSVMVNSGMFEEVSKKNKNLSSNIGISNIRRPRSSSVKPRKPIFPKDNIGLCCRLLKKPTDSKTSLSGTETKKINTSKKKQHMNRTKSGTNLINKTSIHDAPKMAIEITKKNRKTSN